MISNPGIQPFFLPTDSGSRFCLYASVPSGRDACGAILYVHPFAEEMNKSRRMAAVQARRFAAAGYGVLQVDLLGCGDSSGEFGDASIDAWLSDLDAAARWLLAQGSGSLRVWGLRFGALLAAHWAGRTDTPLDGALLWQPVASGETHLNQFLRVGLASEMMTSGAGSTVADFRRRLRSGESIEIGGYEIAPRLAAGIDELSLVTCMRPEQEVDWMEVDATGGGALSPASRRVADAWSERGQVVRHRVVAGDPFWATVEICDCAALLEATSQVMACEWTQR